jgi:signal transduction histidine kinase/ActR/RegA family two-component response regulator
MDSAAKQLPAFKPEEERVLILAPTGRDSAMTFQILSSNGVLCRSCNDLEETFRLMREGASALLVTDEALTDNAVRCLLKVLDEQEPWSDIPLIVFPANGQNAALLLERLGARANVTILERPVRIEILVNAAKSALRARRRQYETRNLLVQLEKADRQKDLFLATLSHELRTPLTAILGWCRLLQTGTLDPVRTATALQVINRSATAQSQLIADILSVSQIVAGTLRIDLVPLDLDAVVKTAIDALRPAAEARGIRLEAVFDNGGWVLGDAGRLQQIFSNVLSNAIKFTPAAGWIHVRVSLSGSNCEIVVRDNGKGISADFLPHVFDHFRQADSSFTRSEGGLGLGLAIVHHLVELHGGTVTAESAGEGSGATFTIKLPAVSGRRDALRGVTTPVAPLLKGLRVLAVDDDQDSLGVLECVLGQYGATVTAVTSSDAALQAVQVEKPDILVSDIGMPGQDGYDLLRNLIASGHSSIPAIALTGYASQKDREQAFAVGYQIHLVKPFEPFELVRSIKQLALRRGANHVNPRECLGT